jgi:mono/diheme cytochrome c family protein
MTNPHRSFTRALVLVAVVGASVLVFAAVGQAATPSPAATKAAFKKNCGTCHTLKAAGTTGKAGPTLDRPRRSLAKITTQIVSGGRFMPSFSGTINSTMIKAIAAYVYAAERK